jgi:hypothetical protein
VIGLLAESRRDRIHALRDLHVSPAMRFVLRRVLFTDRDAEVRALAAERLGEIANVGAWLVDALGDRSPLVRDSVLRALAKQTTGGRRAVTEIDVAPLRRIARGDRTWWVRRSAVYALAAIAGAGELELFQEVLADPFWRVRQAAVRVLAALGARDKDVRDEIAATAPSPTLTYLRASWGPVAIEAPMRAASTTSTLPPELLDPDPAVVTSSYYAIRTRRCACSRSTAWPRAAIGPRISRRSTGSRNRASRMSPTRSSTCSTGSVIRRSRSRKRRSRVLEPKRRSRVAGSTGPAPCAGRSRGWSRRSTTRSTMSRSRVP